MSPLQAELAALTIRFRHQSSSRAYTEGARAAFADIAVDLRDALERDIHREKKEEATVPEQTYPQLVAENQRLREELAGMTELQKNATKMHSILFQFYKSVMVPEGGGRVYFNDIDLLTTAAKRNVDYFHKGPQS